MTPRRELIVPLEAAGSRLDAWLAGELGLSRVAAQRLIEQGGLLVDGRPRDKGHRVSGGEAVSVDADLPAPERAPIAAEPSVVWEDEHLLIVDKPAGVVVHPAPGHHRTTLVDWLAARSGGAWSPHVVHRLDRDTSGLMLVAKGEHSQRALRELIRTRAVEREYVALLQGRPRSKEGTIDAPIGRDPRRRTRMSTRTDKPREARTHFAVERELGPFTLVRVRLETGRTHQIRAHFAALRLPICGDREYGGRRLPGLDRQFLHSARIAFAHPVTGARIELRSPLPDDLAEALRRAEKET